MVQSRFGHGGVKRGESLREAALREAREEVGALVLDEPWLQGIQSGLNIIGVDSSVRFIVTGGVLLLATIIDSLSRRRRSSSGRG